MPSKRKAGFEQLFPPSSQVDIMIERNTESNTFEIHCDEVECDFSEEFYSGGDWGSFIEKAKARGWKIRRDDDLEEWFHTCPGCAGTK